MSSKPVILVIGAGAGIGLHVAKRFVAGGYHACLVRRSAAAAAMPFDSYAIDVTQPKALEDLVHQIEQDVGPIQCAVYNLGAQIGNRSLEETTLKQFELGWKLGTLGLFRLSKSLLPRMADRGSGTLLVTSSTAAVRGNPGQHSHAAAMGGRRMLCQSLRAEYASRGVHVAHVVVDGAVYAPDTLGKMIGQDKLEELNHAGRLMDPVAIAETYWHVAHQPVSARTFELDLRTQKDVAWWNSSHL